MITLQIAILGHGIVKRQAIKQVKQAIKQVKQAIKQVTQAIKQVKQAIKQVTQAIKQVNKLPTLLDCAKLNFVKYQYTNLAVSYHDTFNILIYGYASHITNYNAYISLLSHLTL